MSKNPHRVINTSSSSKKSNSSTETLTRLKKVRKLTEKGHTWADKEGPTAKTRAATLKKALIASQSTPPPPSKRRCQDHSFDIKKTSPIPGKLNVKYFLF